MSRSKFHTQTEHKQVHAVFAVAKHTSQYHIQIQLQLLFLFRVLTPPWRAAGMLLKLSKAVRKTLMPKGS